MFQVSFCSSPRCTGPGLFPNPRTCLSYILCRYLGDVGEILPCVPAGTGFDSRSGLCTLHRRSKVCREGPIPDCLGPGHHDVSSVDPTMFFVCHAPAPATPTLYRCKSGLNFDPHSETCVTPNPCDKSSLFLGPRRLPMPGSCHQYTLCMPGAHYVMTCPKSTVFNPRQGTCSLVQTDDPYCIDAAQQVDYFRSRKKNDTRFKK